MNIYIASIKDEDYSAAARANFESLFECSTVQLHRPVSDPAAADVILFCDLQQQPEDPLLRGLRRHPLVRRFQRRIAVYDERDHPFFTFPGLYVSPSRRLAARTDVVAAPYAAFRPRAIIRDGWQEPRHLFSFRGALSHPVRRKVLELDDPRGVVEDSSAINFFDGTATSARSSAEARFDDLLRQSKFIVCPRGVGSSSFRLYETLAAGRVPVVVSDAWVPPPLVEWEACAVRVPESRVHEIPAILREREPLWPSMVEHGAHEVAARLGDSARWDYMASLLERSVCGGRRRVHPTYSGLDYLAVAARVAKRRIRSAFAG